MPALFPLLMLANHGPGAIGISLLGDGEGLVVAEPLVQGNPRECINRLHLSSAFSGRSVLKCSLHANKCSYWLPDCTE